MALNLEGLTPLLQVYDMPASLRFYRDLLGFEIVSTSPPRDPTPDTDRYHWVWLRLGAADVMLNTAYEFDEERPAVSHPERLRGHNDVGLFIGCPDVDAAYEEFQRKGVAVTKPNITRYGMKQINVRDPDGYGLCFQWRANF
jgi:glyoxylase I family protein